MNVDALIFDLDGTLIDSARDLAGSVNHTLKSMGLPEKSLSEVESYIGDGMKTLLERATDTSDAAVIQKAIDLFKPYYLEHCVDATRLYPGVLEVLDHFRGKKMALVTNKPEAMTAKTLRHLGILQKFGAVIGGDSTERKKPHPDPVLKSLERIGAEPAKSLMVGDGATDVRAGKAAGLYTCAVTYGFKLRSELLKENPDFVLDNITDLIKIVR